MLRSKVRAVLCPLLSEDSARACVFESECECVRA
jgi:hypothetical protein